VKLLRVDVIVLYAVHTHMHHETPMASHAKRRQIQTDVGHDLIPTDLRAEVEAGVKRSRSKPNF